MKKFPPTTFEQSTNSKHGKGEMELSCEIDYGADGLTYCVRCQRLRPAQEMAMIFKTGFHQENGWDYPLALCSHCDFQKVDEGGLLSNSNVCL